MAVSQRLSLCCALSIIALMLFFGFSCSIWPSILFCTTCLLQCLYFVIVIINSQIINIVLEANWSQFLSTIASFILCSLWYLHFLLFCSAFSCCLSYPQDPIFWSTDYQMIFTFISNYLSLLCSRVLFKFDKCIQCPFLNVN